MIEFKMMCVQPIRINSDVYTNMIDDTQFLTVVKNNFDGHTFNIKWLDNFTDKYRKFRSFKPIKLPTDIPKIDLLLEDFSNSRFKVGGELDLGGFFKPNESNVALLYDQRFFSFFIVYELAFSMPEEILLKSLRYSPLNQQKTDLYNSLRRMLVKEEKASELSSWGMSIRDKLITHVTELIDSSISITAPLKGSNVAMIGKNTGNITFYFEADSNNNNLKQAILNCNAGAESIKREIIPVIDNDIVCYCFFGRFHTIISKDNAHYYRYFPIQFHMQFMWFITGFYLEILEKLNDDVNSKNTSVFLKKRLDDVDSYVNQIQFLIMHNEKFKLSIEADHELVLSKIEKSWNIEKSLENSAKYVSMFKEYLGQRHTKKQERATHRQNTILFIISCIQIIALLSVWADYLSITNAQTLPSVGPIAKIFNDPSSLLAFNFWIPAALSVVIFLIGVFTFFKRK
jgi:hypothetical protein